MTDLEQEISLFNFFMDIVDDKIIYEQYIGEGSNYKSDYRFRMATTGVYKNKLLHFVLNVINGIKHTRGIMYANFANINVDMMLDYIAYDVFLILISTQSETLLDTIMKDRELISTLFSNKFTDKQKVMLNMKYGEIF